MSWQVEPPTILMVSAPKHIRGPIPYLTHLLVSGFEELGCKVTLLSCWGQRRPQESLWVKIVQRLGDIVSIASRARAEHFDLIYVHTAHSALLRDIPLLAALRPCKIPVVVLLHGSQIEELAPHRNTVLFFGTELLLRLSNGLLLLSTEEQATFRRLWPWVHCGVVPNPISCRPVNLQEKAVLYKNGELSVLVYAGRFIPDKGVLDILDAFPKVLSQVDCRLIFAGAGPLQAEMEQRVAASRLGHRVEFAGYLDQQGMWKLYQRADVLLLPTYHSEGMPMVVLEAMANGLGIICTRTRGLADYLKEGTNALFVPPRRPDVLADRIVELVSDSEHLITMRECNSELSRHFCPVEVACRQLDVIRSLIAGFDGGQGLEETA